MSADVERIPLLAPKELEAYSPEEFRAYVRGLHFRRTPKKAAPKKKRLRDFAVRAKIKKNGTLSLTTKRDPRYVTEEEMTALAATVSLPLNALYIALKQLGVRIMTHESAERMKESRK
jgi:hypothetical protein